MKFGRKIFAMVDEHTFTLMRTRAHNEGFSLDEALRILVKKYTNGDISLAHKKPKKVAHNTFNYLDTKRQAL